MAPSARSCVWCEHHCPSSRATNRLQTRFPQTLETLEGISNACVLCGMQSRPGESLCKCKAKTQEGQDRHLTAAGLIRSKFMVLTVAKTVANRRSVLAYKVFC